MCLLSEQPAQSRINKLPTLMFVSGIGLSVGSFYLNKSAQDSYDNYLRTAFQSEIKKYRQNYRRIQTASVVVARAGLSIAGLSLIISIWKQATGSVVSHQLTLPQTDTSIGLSPQVDLVKREAKVVWRKEF
ncbi:hypothetical protein MK131_13775 [Candidatus Poribacteria bacterium]|nr:hypothetical protein [Candidatus Poribacteria bacterium]